MLKISDHIEDIINNNKWISFGISSNLLNLSQLAKFIKPQIEARSKKNVTESSILMALSRYSKKHQAKHKHLPDFKIENLSINSDINIRTYPKTKELNKTINSILNTTTEFVTLSEGLTEINLIYSQKIESQITKKLSQKPKFTKKNLSALIIQFNSEYIQVPGFVFFILQQLYIQNINIIEITSTNTELIFYLEKTNSKLAFDTLFQFVGR